MSEALKPPFGPPSGPSEPQTNDKFRLRNIPATLAGFPGALRLVWSASAFLTIVMAMLSLVQGIVPAISISIRGFAHGAIDAVRDQKNMEVVSEFASPISLLAIACVLGMPIDDKQKLRQLENWSDTFGDVTSGYFRGDMQDIKNLEDYFRQLIATKRQDPQMICSMLLFKRKKFFPLRMTWSQIV